VDSHYSERNGASRPVVRTLISRAYWTGGACGGGGVEFWVGTGRLAPYRSYWMTGGEEGASSGGIMVYVCRVGGWHLHSIHQVDGLIFMPPGELFRIFA
jgi:hypothetical protein